MTGRPRLTWRRLLAIAPVLLFAVSLPSQMLLRCHMDGLVRTSCCCPGETVAGGGQGDAPVGAARLPTLRAQACCAPELVTNHAVAVADPNRVATGDGLHLQNAYPVLLAAVEEAPPLSQTCAPGGQGPPLTHTRIVVLKQSFLI